MVRVEFDNFIKEMSAYFERIKAPTQRTMELWYEEVRTIPANQILNLLAEAKNLETWPRNLPAWMRSKSYELKEKSGEANPYRIHERRFHPERYAKPDCPKCAGKGLYDLHMDWPVAKASPKRGDYITRHVVRTALCECTDGAEYGF